jgi:hypothetical protein
MANENSAMKREAGFYCSFASLALSKTTGILNKPGLVGVKNPVVFNPAVSCAGRQFNRG